MYCPLWYWTVDVASPRRAQGARPVELNRQWFKYITNSVYGRLGSPKILTFKHILEIVQTPNNSVWHWHSYMSECQCQTVLLRVWTISKINVSIFGLPNLPQTEFGLYSNHCLFSSTDQPRCWVNSQAKVKQVSTKHSSTYLWLPQVVHHLDISKYGFGFGGSGPRPPPVWSKNKVMYFFTFECFP